jgi:hypothetical protein
LLLLLLGALLGTPLGGCKSGDREAGSSADPQERQCRPTCRTGYECVDGTCVSVCNPPCGDDETCTPERECLTPSDIAARAAEKWARELDLIVAE